MALKKRKSGDREEGERPGKKVKSSVGIAPSILSEEAPFPRGGASVLTPLEHKQIKIQAKQDVLFEQSTGKKAPKNDFEDGEEEELSGEEKENVKSKSRKEKPIKRKRKDSGSTAQEKSLRIESLSYSRLVPGSLVLGQVLEIHRDDIALSLPNNLTGYVALTSLSDQVTKELQRLADQEADDDEAFGDEEQSPLNLREMFTVGQYLRTSVLSTTEEASTGAQSKRHISLSINPQQANAGLKPTDVVVNSMVQASVRSVEDHGVVMDLGLEETDVRGFMSSNELGSERELSQIKEGSVFLCMVMGKTSNGRTIKLSIDPQKISSVKKTAFVADAPSVDSFLPGTAVDILVSEVDHSGIHGKVMGMLDVTADAIHSGAASSNKDLLTKHPVGSKVKGRILCNFPASEQKKLGVSLQDHILYWRPKTATDTSEEAPKLPTAVLQISSIVEQARVAKVEPGSGLYLDIGVKGVRGFAHISKLSDSRIDTLSESTGAYKVGSVHKARIIGYNSMDGLFVLSLEQSVIEQPFIRVQDVGVGQIVQATIQKLPISPDGISAIILELATGITGLVPDTHFADARLQHPERKFKEGMKVTARVLSVDLQARKIRLTLKKTLVNSNVEPWTRYEDLKVGMQGPGVLMKILSNGAVVHFYNRVRAFLPISEMSEAYIQNPLEHFHKGQAINVHVISIDPEHEKMNVSCKAGSTEGLKETQDALRVLTVGEKVNGTVSEKIQDSIIIELEGSALKAILPFEHLVDAASSKKAEQAAKKIRVGQVLEDLIVLSNTQRLVQLTSKPSLVKATEEGRLLMTIGDVTEGMEVSGYVNNITVMGVFVSFGGELTGLLKKHQIEDSAIASPDFGFRRNQSITTRVLSVDHAEGKFLLTCKPLEIKKNESLANGRASGTNDDSLQDGQLSNPADGTSKSVADFTIGKVTAAKIVSVKGTQMNVLLADGVQGRIDVSEVFDDMTEVSDRKHPLKKFQTKKVIPVRVLGMHDTRNHRFLPITHRQSRGSVFELTAKPNSVNAEHLDILTLNKVKVGSQWLVAVNNVEDDCVWVNLSPNVRGRIRAMDVSEDISLLGDLAGNFPIGSLLKAKVLRCDVATNRLDLTARASGSAGVLKLQDLSSGMVLPGRVTKVTDRQVMVQLSEELVGAVQLVDIADDYSEANPYAYEKNQTVRVCVRDIDKPNKRVALSTRPSKILSSSLPVKDKEITSISQLAVTDVVRGFIKNVAASGIFVSLACNITAFVRISELSDEFLKDWKAGFEIDQLVQGRIIVVDPSANQVQMSLKRSKIDKDYKPPLTLADMEVGQTVTGKIKKVEHYGVFVLVDNSSNVSGLCHRSKLSDTYVDPKKLFQEGDVVKAKIINIDMEKGQISFGLKPSYFDKDEDEKDAQEDDNDDHEMSSGNGLSDSGEEGSMFDGFGLTEADGVTDDDMDVDHAGDFESKQVSGEAEKHGVSLSEPQNPVLSTSTPFAGLSAGKIDWTGGMETFSNKNFDSETDDSSTTSPHPKKKKKPNRKPTIFTDQTGSLDAHGPQTPADFERLLLTHPSSSHLWLQYIAHHLSTPSLPTARATATRALATIPASEETEKLNIHLALLNLETTYGTPTLVTDAFTAACAVNDPQTVHEKLTSIYIAAGQHANADALFQTTLTKFPQSPELYVNYATFLLSTLSSPADRDRARALLPRAVRSLPPHTHISISSKFAVLEFKHGDPERGRTLFENLLAQWPKRLDLWNVLIDMEIAHGAKGEPEVVRRVFERVTAAERGLKPRKARFFFKKWGAWEEGVGDGRGKGRVEGLAGEYVRRAKEGGKD